MLALSCCSGLLYSCLIHFIEGQTRHRGPCLGCLCPFFYWMACERACSLSAAGEWGGNLSRSRAGIEPRGRRVAGLWRGTAGPDLGANLCQRHLHARDNVLARVPYEMLALHRVDNGLAYFALPPQKGSAHESPEETATWAANANMPDGSQQCADLAESGRPRGRDGAHALQIRLAAAVVRFWRVEPHHELPGDRSESAG